MKNYPVEIEVYSWLCGDPMDATKGHHSKEALIDALEKEYGHRHHKEDIEIEHVWLRCSPAQRNSEFGYMLIVCDGPGRGIFPVTRIKRG